MRGAQRNSVDGVALLIDLGFDVNAINRLDRYHESAPLHEAAATGNLEVIELLLAHGADPTSATLRTTRRPPAGPSTPAIRRPSDTSRPGRRERIPGFTHL